jgi:hypothetical protein
MFHLNHSLNSLKPLWLHSIGIAYQYRPSRDGYVWYTINRRLARTKQNNFEWDLFMGNVLVTIHSKYKTTKRITKFFNISDVQYCHDKKYSNEYLWGKWSSCLTITFWHFIRRIYNLTTILKSMMFSYVIYSYPRKAYCWKHMEKNEYMTCMYHM